MKATIHIRTGDLGLHLTPITTAGKVKIISIKIKLNNIIPE